MLTGSAEQFARQSYADQIGGLFQGFIRAEDGREWSANNWYDAHDTSYSQARLARNAAPGLARVRAELARITVLRCTRPVVFAAIASSPACTPYLRGTLAPDLLLVDERYIKPLKDQLAWAGLDVADVLELKQ